MGKMVVRVGSILQATDGHIVHGCNAQGKMGKGLALSIKNMYPDAFDAYVETHEEHGLILGTSIPVKVTDKLVIWNAITQEYYKNCKGAPDDVTRWVSYDAIDDVFKVINDAVGLMRDIPAVVHIPMIGTDLGGGDWDIIKTIIEKATPDVTVILWVLE